MSLFFKVPITRRSLRLLHTSSRSHNLIGPSDPISNIRPVIYDDPPAPHGMNHPYSLGEFSGKAQDHDLQWRLQRQQLDAFNHEFWTDSNTRFESAKQSVLSSLPESSTTQARERALSEFYKKWVTQESTRLEAYTSEWRTRNFEAIIFAAKVEWRNLQTRLKKLLTFGGGR